MALRAQKELELKVHEEFYKNVHTLTLIYPPSPEFREVFKQDMFIKNNKAGFHQVIYYLLEILDSEKLKQKVPTWPPYDLRLENQFRNEVMKYINELNLIYEDANIPQLATSHLISPGGFKFVKFMFKLSQFVLYQQLKNNPPICSGILLPMKPSKREFVTNENLQKLQGITSIINEEIDQMKFDFEKHFNAAKFEAEEIVRKQQETNRCFKEDQLKLQSIKQLNDDFPTVQHNQSAQLTLASKLDTLRQLKEKFSKCEELGAFLSSSQARLEHNNELKVPPQIAHIVSYDGENLDISSLLEGCIKLVDRKRLEIKPMSDQDVLKQIERFKVLNDQLNVINEEMEQIYLDSVKLSGKLQTEPLEDSVIHRRKVLHPLQMEKLQENDSDSTNSTALAEPLPPSPLPNNKHNFLFDECYEQISPL